MMVRFVRVVFSDDIGRRPVFLRVTSETDGWLCGWRVNRNGDEIASKGHTQIKDIIDKAAVASICEYRENRTYGHLEPVR